MAKPYGCRNDLAFPSVFASLYEQQSVRACVWVRVCVCVCIPPFGAFRFNIERRGAGDGLDVLYTRTGEREVGREV